ncbi:MAG TPA: hypothetical protein VKR22_06455 [Acidimicrobiales bacterium]|nr:hypothetical protein [Acidimicrobiales bacterium]
MEVVIVPPRSDVPSPDEEEPMTQHSAIVCEDKSILFVSDRKERQSSGDAARAELVDKAKVVPSEAGFIWSWAGIGNAEHAATIVEEWLCHEANLSSWKDLVSALSDEVRNANVACNAGAIFLFAGFLGGVPGILHVHRNGIHDWDDGTPRCDDRAIGQSCLTVSVAWEYVKRFHPEDRTARHYCDLVMMVNKEDPDLCGLTAYKVFSDNQPRELFWASDEGWTPPKSKLAAIFESAMEAES